MMMKLLIQSKMSGMFGTGGGAAGNGGGMGGLMCESVISSFRPYSTLLLWCMRAYARTVRLTAMASKFM